GAEGVLAAARIAFLVDAGTFVASYLAVSRLPELGTATSAEAAGGGRFLDALRLPLVRSLAPAAAVVAFGLGALFSLGVVWVQEVLDASNVEFGLLVVCFGVGAGGGLGALRWLPRHALATVRAALVAEGAVVAVMSLLATPVLALTGALLFG